MKKLLSVILISMLVLTGAFAATSNMVPSSTKPDAGVTSTVDVGLEVNPAKMTSYAFGFSSIVGSVDDLGKSADLTKLPTAFGAKLALNYDVAKGIGTTAAAGGAEKNIWMYFKIQSGEAVTLEITAGKMHDQGLGHATDIDMIVEGTRAGQYSVGDGALASSETFTASSSTGQKGTVTITPSQSPVIEFNAASYKLTVTTSKVPVLAQTAQYLGTITVNVQSA